MQKGRRWIAAPVGTGSSREPGQCLAGKPAGATGLRYASSSNKMHDGGNEEEREENKEDDFSDAHRGARDAGEPKNSGDQGDHEEGQNPAEHLAFSIRR